MYKVRDVHQRWKDVVFGYVHHRCQSLLPKDITYFQIPEIVKFTILLFYYHTLESSILTDDECGKLLSLFDQQNKFQELQPFEYKLIFLSTKHGTAERIFKSMCHNQSNILCIIESENGNVFGGYTKHGWNDSDDAVIHDKDAFIFSIRSNRGFSPAIFNAINDGEDALWKGLGYYCVFGEDCAFFINSDGTTGYGGTVCGNYEKYPMNDYLVDKDRVASNHSIHMYAVKQIEVFQLK